MAKTPNNDDKLDSVARDYFRQLDSVHAPLDLADGFLRIPLKLCRRRGRGRASPPATLATTRSDGADHRLVQCGDSSWGYSLGGGAVRSVPADSAPHPDRDPRSTMQAR